MLIGFDASRAFVSQPTGTENYSLNLLKALIKVDQINTYRVYLRQEINVRRFIRKIPKNFSFKVIRPVRLWTQIGLALETWQVPVQLLFVPAHTLPILRNPKVKSVVTIHDLGVEYLPGSHQFPQRLYLDFAGKYASKHADALIAVSRATGADLVTRYRVDRKKIFVVHEGVDRGFFKPQSPKEIQKVKSKYQIDGKYILFVGTIQPRKNLEMLIKAFAKLAKGRSSSEGRGATLTLVIAGKPGWDYEPIIAAPKKFGVEKYVKFIGRVADPDLPALYSGASAFAFPSLFEGFGLPILEALSCGCPVIASDIGPHREILEKLAKGRSSSEGRGTSLTRQIAKKDKLEAMVLAKPTSVDQWTQFLYQAITKDNKEVDFSNIGLKKFSWDEAAAKTLKVFEAILG